MEHTRFLPLAFGTSRPRSCTHSPRYCISHPPTRATSRSKVPAPAKDETPPRMLNERQLQDHRRRLSPDPTRHRSLDLGGAGRWRDGSLCRTQRTCFSSKTPRVGRAHRCDNRRRRVLTVQPCRGRRNIRLHDRHLPPNCRPPGCIGITQQPPCAKLITLLSQQLGTFSFAPTESPAR